jgi:hypothetical protein
MASFAASKKDPTPPKPTPSEKAFTTINAAGVSTFAQTDLIKSGLNDKNLDAWWTNINAVFKDALREDALSKKGINDIPNASTYFKLLNNIDIFIKNTVTKLNTTYKSLYVKEGDTYVPHFENSTITHSDINELTDFNIKARNLKKDTTTTIIQRMDDFSKKQGSSVQRMVLSTYAMIMESVLNQIIRETNTLLAQAEAKSGTYPKKTFVDELKEGKKLKHRDNQTDQQKPGEDLASGGAGSQKATMSDFSKAEAPEKMSVKEKIAAEEARIKAAAEKQNSFNR